jgi:NAD dependent epimerase/dehydratase family
MQFDSGPPVRCWQPFRWRRKPPHRAASRARTRPISNQRDRGGDHWSRWQTGRGKRRRFHHLKVYVVGPTVIVYTRGKTRFTSARDAGIAVGILLPRRTATASFSTNLSAPCDAPREPTFMTVLIIGGTGFIGRRLIPLLAQRGEESVVMDINPQTANFSELTKVKVLRGDVSQFDDVMAVMTAVKPDRVVNLISSDLPPRIAFKLNILGMDNCF